MNLKISDTALDLGVFALDNEFENSVTRNWYSVSSPALDGSPTRDPINEECFAVAS
jgi:hypothetical protein